LLLRLLALVLLGAAFARPVVRGGGASRARVVIVDRSRSALPDVRDSAHWIVRPGDAIVLADAAPRRVRDGATDSLRALTPNASAGSMSAALVTARRAARELADRADSVELVIISPFTRDEFDAATAPLAASWPGRLRVVRSRAAPTLARVEARVVPGALSTADSLAARDGAAVVHWPPLDGSAPAAEGVWARGTTLVALLGRRPIDTTGQAIAFWADGSPAVVERPLGRGCIREVGVGVPLAGDLTLRSAFVRFQKAVTGGCGMRARGEVASDSIVKSLARGSAAASARLLAADDDSSPLAPWLVGFAMLALVAEWFVRRRNGAPE
jgi:hypothetical protein